MGLIEIIKEVAKDDTDFSKVEGQLSGYVNLAELPKEKGMDTIKAYPSLLSAFDSEMSKGVNSGVENFKSKGMLDILKEKEEAIRAEINPKETPEQKKIRELEQRIEASDKDKMLSTLQDELSNKAKELGFDTIKAKRYAKYGEDAFSELEADAEWLKAEVESQVGTQIKTKFSLTQPKSTKVPIENIDDKILAARKAGNGALALKLQRIKKDKQ